MPVYLVHGFRWPRDGFTGIRVHAVLNNLDGLSVEYVQNGSSRCDLIRSLRRAYPDLMKELDQSDLDNEVYAQPGLAGSGRIGGGAGVGRRLEFIEQYNPEDIDGPYATGQPYAYVGDKVVVIAASSGTGVGLNGTSMSQQEALDTTSANTPRRPTPRTTTSHSNSTSKILAATDTTALSINVEDVMANGPGLTNKAWEALADLRDKIAEGEKIGWWVVYNGDPDRSFDDPSDEDEEYDEEIEGVDEEGEENVTPQQREDDIYSDRLERQRSLPLNQKGHRTTESDLPPIPASAIETHPAHISSQYQPQPQPQTPSQVQQQQLPHHYHQVSSPGLTALPPHPSSATVPKQDPFTSISRPNTAPSDIKSKGRDVQDELPKVKEVGKSQGFRRKFFGRKP